MASDEQVIAVHRERAERMVRHGMHDQPAPITFEGLLRFTHRIAALEADLAAAREAQSVAEVERDGLREAINSALRVVVPLIQDDAPPEVESVALSGIYDILIAVVVPTTQPGEVAGGDRRRVMARVVSRKPAEFQFVDEEPLCDSEGPAGEGEVNRGTHLKVEHPALDAPQFWPWPKGRDERDRLMRETVIPWLRQHVDPLDKRPTTFTEVPVGRGDG